MTSDFTLDWLTLAISIFNTILLLWLGLTVLLNAERRSLGIWVAGGGLLLSSLFFLSHTAILASGPLQPEPYLNVWWKTGWIPVVIMPYAWYMVMLWYSSYWDAPHSSIRERHQVPMVLATLLALSTVGLVFLFNALPAYNQLVRLDLGGVLAIGGVPILMVVYPIYLVICIGFSLDVLLHPGAPVRLMGQLARQRARTWLLAATTSLLLVSLLVGGIIIWGIYYANQAISQAQFAITISIFDLLIDLLIAVTILSVGQAVVSYEIFTGKILPRQGLKRYWKLAILLSLGLGMIISWALLYQLEPIYLLLLSILLITGIYALLSWRAFVDQEQYLKILNPFFTNQHLYDRLLLQDPSAIELDITRPFHAFCHDVLGVKQAFLFPLGIFSPLVGRVISHPDPILADQHEELLAEIRRIIPPQVGLEPILLTDSRYFERNSIAITLWSERGLIGVLVLGEKQNSSLFTHEEIEISRSVGERLIDSKASNELALKLVELERQRLSETKVIDQHTRRTLHDEILPRLQSTMIRLSSSTHNSDGIVQEMGEIHRQLTEVMRELPTIQEAEVKQLGLLPALRSTIEKEYHPYFNEITWQITEQAAEKSGSIPAYALDVLYHAAREAVRNAARHGRQPGSDQPINLDITINWQEGLVVKIQDDGIGFDPTAKNGSSPGQGLALHSALMAVVGGSLSIESIPKRYTQVILKLPASYQYNITLNT